MEDKRKDLKSSHQKQIISRIVDELNKSHPSFYYLSTTEIASEVKKHIDKEGNLSREDHQIVKGLDWRDIQMLLSLHDDQ